MDSERFKDVVEKVMSAIIEGYRGRGEKNLGIDFRAIIESIIPIKNLKDFELETLHTSVDEKKSYNQVVLDMCVKMLATRKYAMDKMSRARGYKLETIVDNLYNCLEMFIPVLEGCVEDSDEFYEIIRVCLMGLSASLKNYKNQSGDERELGKETNRYYDNTYNLFMAIARIIDGMNASKRRFVESAHSLPNNSLEWQAIHRIVTILHTSSQ